MTTLLDFLRHVPAWVFAVFVLLAGLGAGQMRRHGLPLARAVLLPAGMAALSLYGTVSTFGDRPPALLAWAVAGMLAAAAVLRRPLPPTARYDPAARRFDLPGSPVPLALLMGLFTAKFAVGMVQALQPDLAHEPGFALVAGTLYGAFAGSFLARALRLGRLARRQDASAHACLD
jgi:hypothetical protein